MRILKWLVSLFYGPTNDDCIVSNDDLYDDFDTNTSDPSPYTDLDGDGIPDILEVDNDLDGNGIPDLWE